MNAKLPSHIRFIGAEDDDLDLFEGQYPLQRGISYNSYFITDELTAVIDAVDARRCGTWLDSIPAAPDVLIVQHVEPDHSGSVRALIQRYPAVKVVCTAKAAAMLANYFDDIDFTGDRCIIVADGDTLSLGRTQLKFLTAPMVHWPEVMLTLDVADGVLFSADAFGSFAMSSEPVADAWDAEARRYYTNIVGRFGNSVQALMKKVAAERFSIVAPLHGPVLAENLTHHWQLYDKWSRWEAESDGVLVAYASVYGGTAEAARLIAVELLRLGVEDVVLMDLCRHHVSYAVAEAFRLRRMVLCSVTYDGMLFPAMADFLHHLEMKQLRHRRVALVENGSWAPVAARLMADALSRLKDIEVIGPVLTIRSRLHAADRDTIAALARNLIS